jgi:hypothetical protein
MRLSHTTALRRGTNDALSFGLRFCLLERSQPASSPTPTPWADSAYRDAPFNMIIKARS